MEKIEFKIKGFPYPRLSRKRGRRSGPSEWREAIIEQSKAIPFISSPCSLSVDFILDKSQCPKDYPYGPDIDNLLKPVFDAFKHTFLKDDSFITELIASKKIGRKRDDLGMSITIQIRSMDKEHLINKK